MLAALNIIDHVSDHAWPGCEFELWGMTVTWMSSSIATMLMVAVALSAVLIPVGRRARVMPTGLQNAVELLVVFVRDMIARPALNERAYAYLPLLLTLFVFILGMNLFGILPVESISVALGLPHFGAPATSVAAVCVALGLIALGAILYAGLKTQALRAHRDRGWPLAACVALAPLLWFVCLSPHIEGVIGKLMLLPLALLELVGVFAKCFSLMVRLCANMMSGHTLLAVMMVFLLQTLIGFVEGRQLHVFYVGPACVVASLLISLLELLVAGLQAYIFTFLTAMFLGLYVETGH